MDSRCDLEVAGERVRLRRSAVTYMIGEIAVPWRRGRETGTVDEGETMRTGMMRTASLLALCAMTLPAGLTAQPAPGGADAASPEAAVAAAYEAINHEPGENFDWERFHALYLPGAVLIPNVEQTEGELRVMSPEEFTAYIDGWFAENAPIGSEADRGFYEEQIHSVKNDYGDVVQIMSTYQKRYADSEEILGRGVNAFTLVFDGEGWRIAAVAWDEEDAAGPIPEKYLP